MKTAGVFSILFCMSFLNLAKAQSIEEQMARRQPSCNEVFLNAVDILPKLYRQHAFDSMYSAVQIWKRACGNTQEIQCASLLLLMQQNNFTNTSLDSTIIDLLNNYANSFGFFQRNMSQYFKGQRDFYKLSSIWAKLLMEQKALDENEKFFCGVFSGSIIDPLNEIKTHPEKSPQLAELLKQKNAAQRNGYRSNLAFLTGIWMPKNDLQMLGNHPSIGFQLGFRDVHNEFDFTLQFRFLQSANTYLVKRSNVLYDSRHYFGGYIGIDYTYYFVSKQQYDVGLLVGAGYDGFDVFSSEYNNNGLQPLSIGSFNANGGLKYNLFVTPTFYVGLQGRYNLVNYTNRGGTSLNGNAFSIDLIIGGNKLHK